MCASAIPPFSEVVPGRDAAEGFTLAPGDEARLGSCAAASVRNVEVAAAMPGNRNGNNPDAQWKLLGIGSDGDAWLSVCVSWGNETMLDETFNRRHLTVTVDTVGAGGSVRVLSTDVFDDVDLYRGVNVLSMEMAGGVASLWIGCDYQRVVGSFACHREVDAFAVAAASNLEVACFVSEWMPDASLELRAPFSAGELHHRLEQATGIEGVWQFLDRDTDAAWAEPGGFYRLGVVRHAETPESGRFLWNGKPPVYDIIYLDGASVNAGRWLPGMIKGRMYATPFENHYDVVWFDSKMEWMGREVSADFTAPSILSFHFPLHRALMRFAREDTAD